MTLPKILLILAVVLILPSTVFATSIVGLNFGGTFANTTTSISLSSASFVLVLPTFSSGGTLAFSLSNPVSPNAGDKTWTGNGIGALSFTAPGGISFLGSFYCSPSCKYVSSPSGFLGDFSGLLTIGSTTQEIAGRLSEGFSGTNGLSGSLTATAVPEIGTLSMVGMGLLGIAGFTRKKFSAIAGKLRILGHV